MLAEGVDVDFYGDDGTLTAGKVWLIDYARPENNDRLVIEGWCNQNHFRVLAEYIPVAQIAPEPPLLVTQIRDRF